MTDQELVVRAVRKAQILLAAYIEPGPRDADATINRLLQSLIAMILSQPSIGSKARWGCGCRIEGPTQKVVFSWG